MKLFLYEDSSPLACSDVTTGKLLQKFQRILVPSGPSSPEE